MFIKTLLEATVDTVTAVVTYPVDIITEGPLQATADMVGEVAHEVGNVAGAAVADPVGAVVATLILDYNA